MSDAVLFEEYVDKESRQRWKHEKLRISRHVFDSVNFFPEERQRRTLLHAEAVSEKVWEDIEERWWKRNHAWLYEAGFRQLRDFSKSWYRIKCFRNDSLLFEPKLKKFVYLVVGRKIRLFCLGPRYGVHSWRELEAELRLKLLQKLSRYIHFEGLILGLPVMKMLHNLMKDATKAGTAYRRKSNLQTKELIAGFHRTGLEWLLAYFNYPEKSPEPMIFFYALYKLATDGFRPPYVTPPQRVVLDRRPNGKIIYGNVHASWKENYWQWLVFTHEGQLPGDAVCAGDKLATLRGGYFYGDLCKTRGFDKDSCSANRAEP